jgi:hypothetical protein
MKEIHPMKARATSFTMWARAALLVSALGLIACGPDDGAEIEECDPPGACSCEPGTERETSCSCTGGSECVIEGDSIEFHCDGNAGCGMTCGTDCLITCPGTTSCDVVVDEAAVIDCPGTAECYVTCLGSCTLSMAGASRSTLICDDPAADCAMEGCSATDCGDGVFTCRSDCPETPVD